MDIGSFLQNSIQCINITLFIPSSTDGHLTVSRFLDVTNKSAVNIF